LRAGGRLRATGEDQRSERDQQRAVSHERLQGE
jgi:hypothetical protein